MRAQIGAIVALAFTMSMPLYAHHTISAIDDINKLVTLKGVVTEVEWHNPHVVVHLDVKNDDGSIVNWSIETQAIYNLKSHGLDRDSVKAGETVSVNVFVAKDGALKAALETVTLPTGTAYISMLPTQSGASPEISRDHANALVRWHQ